MKNSTPTSFTSGEFAALCATTKETLRHYCDIGILKPDHIGDNGYQRYSPSQFFDFYLISSLKRAGTPLTDIRRYLSRPDTGDYLQLLYRQEQALNREKMLLERMEHLVHQSIENIELAMTVSGSLEEPELVAYAEEYYVVVEAPNIKFHSELDYFSCLQDHVHYCTQHDLGAEFQIGVIVQKEAFLAGAYQPSYFCSRISKQTTCDRLYIKPGGTYVTMLYKGGIETDGAYQKIKDFITVHGLTVTGHAYEYELAGYLSTGDNRNYICRISVQVG